MKYCSHCGKEILEDTVVCPHCGCSVSNQKVGGNEEASGGLKFVSFIFPLVGLILFIVFNDKEPKKAKACGKMALISACIVAALYIIYAVVLGAAIGSMI